ncbi:hypothetical protein CW362_29545 [Streptomyces populi]|uniref:Lipoprotein n=1 Tax=Streptomyces populi TaxID=2058924 RepID=A0A2I0SHS8_9ACTN|nr:hypothetical protein [Streptomyces populi]PKT69475.1 hypothetical protein CW362_29545 [Streptomyces populi]
MIGIRVRHVFGASSLVVLLASSALACSGGQGAPPGDGESPVREVRKTASASRESAAAPATEGVPAPSTAQPAPGADVEKVRDVFARLQATYNDGCTTPGNCEYFLGRVFDELGTLDKAMEADPQGPGHFKEPRAWIADLRTGLGGDRSFENLKKHQDLLIGTRDKINAWMQGHPEDYR